MRFLAPGWFILAGRPFYRVPAFGFFIGLRGCIS